MMDDPRARQGRHDHPIEAVPCQAAALAPSIQPCEQKPPGLIHVLPETATVATDSVILDVALKMSLDISPALIEALVKL